MAANCAADQGAFASCLSSREPARSVEDDVAAGTALGVTGTPYVYLNGELIKGVYPYTEYKAKIEKLLAH